MGHCTSTYKTRHEWDVKLAPDNPHGFFILSRTSSSFCIPSLPVTFTIEVELQGCNQLRVTVAKRNVSTKLQDQAGIAKITLTIDAVVELTGGILYNQSTTECKQIYSWSTDCVFDKIQLLTSAKSSDFISEISKICCEIEWYGFVKEMEPAAPSVCDMTSFLLSPILSDVTLVAENRLFPAHRCVLASSSRTFSEILEDTQLENNPRVKIQDLDADVLEVLLKYIYTGEVDGIRDTNMAWKLFYASHRFALYDLAKLAERKLEESLTLDNAVDIFNRLDKCSLEQFLTRWLRSKVVGFIAKHRQEMVKRKDFEQLLLKKPQLAVDIMNK